MKKLVFRYIKVLLSVVLLVNMFGCAALKKKFTRKEKTKKAVSVFYKGKKYDVKPSLDLYEKHYVFWVNWHRKLIDELGKNVKSDIRSSQEVMGNLEDMASLLVDEKAAEIKPHIAEIKKAKAIIDKRSMTTANQTRIRIILEREHRIIKREFSIGSMTGYIREDWKEIPIGND